MLEFLAENKLTRSDFVVALGGGVVHAAANVAGHEEAVEVPVGNEPVLQRLRHAVGKGVRGQGPEGVRIADHHFRLVEGPRQILPRRQVDGGLPPTDTTVEKLYAAAVCRSLQEAGFRVCLHAFPAGEQSKNLGTFGGMLESG